jgi:hypothetical protein
MCPLKWAKAKKIEDDIPNAGVCDQKGKVLKIVIIADLHGNYEAFRALPEGYDELWLLGDLVNYGPEPAAVVNFVKDKSTVDDELGVVSSSAPGSLGQPKTGQPDACYAVWADGAFELKSFPYAVDKTVGRLQALSFPHDVEKDLITVLRTGSVS